MSVSRAFTWARTLLAFSALGCELLLPRGDLRALAAIAGFCGYALFTALRRRSPGRILGLLGLFADSVFFLILTAFSAAASAQIIWAFYVYLLLEGVLLHGPREVLVVAAISNIFWAFERPLEGLRQWGIWTAGLLAVVFSFVRTRLTQQVQQLERAAAMAREEASKARQNESQRIASDFHDGPLQSFISLQMRLDILRKLLERDRHAALSELEQLQQLAQAQVRELRAFIRSMRPLDVDGKNLMASARRLTENFQKESGIPVTFVGSDGPLAVPDVISTEVVQILRESLHNVQKHARATRVAVALEQVDRMLEVSIDDNGQGFRFSGLYNLEELELLRLGPASLKRRARALNAEMILESRPGRGAGIKFRIPVGSGPFPA